MNVSLAWLVTGADPIDSRRALRQALLEGYDTTEFISAGRRPSKPPIAFNEAWLFALLFGAPDEPTGPGALSSPLLTEMNDDSMEPTIGKGDLVLVDRSFGLRPFELQQALREKRSIHYGIYAFKAGLLSRRANDSNDQFIVRRVQYRLDGNVGCQLRQSQLPRRTLHSTEIAGTYRM